MAVQPWRRWRLSRQISGSWEEIFQSCVYISYPPVRQRPGRSPLFGSPVQLTDCRRDCTSSTAEFSGPSAHPNEKIDELSVPAIPHPAASANILLLSKAKGSISSRTSERNLQGLLPKTLFFFFFQTRGRRRDRTTDDTTQTGRSTFNTLETLPTDGQ